VEDPKLKQKKFGEKVQNWHRPLGQNQLRRRFLRHRDDDPHAELERRQYVRGDVEVDDCWDIYDRICGRRGCPNPEPLADDAFIIHRFKETLSELARWPQRLFENEWEICTPQKLDSGSHDDGRRSHSPVEQRLAAHVGSILSGQSIAAVQATIRDCIGEKRNIDVLERASKRLQCTDLTQRVCLFSPFWIRSPCTWHEDGNTSLVDHVFVRYSVPEFLHAAWFRQSQAGEMDHPSRFFKWLCWFIILAQGGSLYRAGRLFEWAIARRFQHHLADAPPRASSVEACIHAEVMQLGGSHVEVARIVSCEAFIIDPTEMSADVLYQGFWRDTVLWLVANRDAITDDEARLVLEWAIHEYLEARRAERRFSWKGRTAGATLERSLRYRRTMERPWSALQWNTHGWDWAFEDGDESWSFVELTSGGELFAEGEALHHCVASYAGRCAAGHSAIMSVRCNGLRRVTLEINPRNSQIVQTRGERNRPPTVSEQRAIGLWVGQLLLRRKPAPET
jgi:hypothetical protein